MLVIRSKNILASFYIWENILNMYYWYWFIIIKYNHRNAKVNRRVEKSWKRIRICQCGFKNMTEAMCIKWKTIFCLMCIRKSRQKKRVWNMLSFGCDFLSDHRSNCDAFICSLWKTGRNRFERTGKQKKKYVENTGSF